MNRVHLPHRRAVDEDEPIENGAGLLQHADDPVGILAVPKPGIAFESVRTDERCAGAKAGVPGRARPRHRLHRPFPQPPLRKPAAVVVHVVAGRADDAESPVGVPEREGNHTRHHRMTRDGAKLGEGDVAGRDVGVKDGGEDELQAAALGADHEVDAACVAADAVLELALEQEHHDDGCNPEREQQHRQDRRQRPAADGSGAEYERVHGAGAGVSSASR